MFSFLTGQIFKWWNPWAPLFFFNEKSIHEQRSMSAKGCARPEVNEKSVNGHFQIKSWLGQRFNGQRSMTTKSQVMNKGHCQFMLRVQQLNFFIHICLLKYIKKIWYLVMDKNFCDWNLPSRQRLAFYQNLWLLLFYTPPENLCFHSYCRCHRVLVKGF